MGRTNNNIKSTVYTTGSGLLNEFGNQLANEIGAYLPDPSVDMESSSILRDGIRTLSKTADADETTDTTTANYTVGQYIYQSTSGILYECILNSTSGELLTNATYFTAVTSNTLTVSGDFIYTIDRALKKESVSGVTVDFATASDGINYVAKEYLQNSYIFSTTRPTIGEVIPNGNDNTNTTDLIPTMLSNSQDGYILTASSVLGGSQIYYAFEDTATNAWTTNSTTIGWIQAQLPLAKAVNKFTILPRASVTSRAPKDFSLQASNTGLFSGEEVTLGSWSSVTDWADGVVKTFTCENETSYLYYRIDVTANNGDVTYLAIDEIEFIESQEKAPYYDVVTGKWFDGTGTEYTNQPSWMPYPFMVASGTPQQELDETYGYEPLASVVFDNVEVSGYVKANKFKGVNIASTLINFDGNSVTVKSEVNVQSLLYTDRFRIVFDSPYVDTNYYPSILMARTDGTTLNANVAIRQLAKTTSYMEFQIEINGVTDNDFYDDITVTIIGELS